MSDLVKRINDFLDANYPCGCGDDPECPGNYYEALAIAEMVEEHRSA